MSEILLAFTLLAFMLFWKFVWQKTLLGYTRDKLFDLRDELRTWFIENNYGLNHPVYKELRFIINNHLRHTERATMISFLAFYTVTKKSHHSNEDMVAHLNSIFKTNDDKLDSFTKKIRNKAFYVLLTQMIGRSVFLCILTVFIAIFASFQSFVEMIKKQMKFSSMVAKPIMTTFMIGIVSLIPLLRGGPTIMERYSNSAHASTITCPHS